MKNLKDFDLYNKRILVRCDFNVPLDDKGNILDSSRIEKTLPTIKYLIEKRAKVILISHLGSPKPDTMDKLSLRPVWKKLTELLNIPIVMTSGSIEEKTQERTQEMQPGQVLLLENIRFYKEEEENDPEFSRKLAQLGDIYVNDAFGVCHRKHASVVGIPKHLPSGMGLLLENEIKVLSQVLENPKRPFVAVIGGLKIESKIKVIKQFLEKADHVLIGGKIANTILTVKGICVGRPWPEEEAVKDIEKLDLTSVQLHLPIDVMVSSDNKGIGYIKDSAPAKAKKDEFILDIGPETIDIFSTIINTAKTIVWSGPMGFFEEPKFKKGTENIAKTIADSKAYKIVGGGDTLFAISKFGLKDKFDHISTGGGAMLKFLSGDKLPGLEALEK